MLPASGEYSKLGKGSLLLKRWVNGSPAGPWMFRENMTSISIAADVQKAELFSSTQASAPKINETPTRTGFTVNLTSTAYVLTNLNDFLLGEQVDNNQAAAVAQTKAFPGSEVIRGGFLDLGARSVTNVVVTADGSEVLEADVDYVLYADHGIIGITANASIADGTDISVAFDQAARTRKQIRIGKEASPLYQLLYLADDANADGASARDRLELWKVNITPSGELPLVSDDFATFPLAMSVLADTANHQANPFGYLERASAA